MSPGRGQESEELPTLDVTEENDRILLRIMLIAHYEGKELWKSDEVEDARKLLVKHFGRLVGFDDFHVLSSQEDLNDACMAVVQEKREAVAFEARMNGVNSPCHICGSNPGVKHFPFGMANVIAKKMDWGKTASSVAASIVVSAITAPLLGVWGWSISGKKTTAKIVRLQLVLCEECLKSRKRFFGNTRLSTEDYSKQPCFDEFRELGYTTVLNEYLLKQYKPTE